MLAEEKKRRPGKAAGGERALYHLMDWSSCGGLGGGYPSVGLTAGRIAIPPHWRKGPQDQLLPVKPIGRPMRGPCSVLGATMGPYEHRELTYYGIPCYHPALPATASTTYPRLPDGVVLPQ